jgi:holo-[acyl-carrier protein] synthase
MAVTVGIDLVAVASIAESLAADHASHYLERVYTPQEVEDCRDPSGEIVPMRLAARFAAKEAAIKALPGGGEGVPLSSIEVRRDEKTGEVALELSGRAAEAARQAGISGFALSLTHEREYAAAAVVAEAKC